MNGKDFRIKPTESSANDDNLNREYSIDDLDDYSFKDDNENEVLVEISEEELLEITDEIVDERLDEEMLEIETALLEDNSLLTKTEDTYVEDYYNNEIIQDNYYDDADLAAVIDIYSDKQQLEAIMGDFTRETWENLTITEQQERIDDLKNYIVDCIGLENPPEVTYYYNENPGDYAYVDPNANVICINEYNLWNNEEAADTIAHELWHSYQHQRANILENERDQLYLEGFENYISCDIDPIGYEEQFVEADAREFAQRFKDIIKDME